MTDHSDMMEYRHQARDSSYEEFVRKVDVARVVRLQHDLDLDPENGWTNVLHGALRNDSIEARVRIAEALLDAGWKVGRIDLAILFEHHVHDAELELPLLARLLDGGSDPLAVVKGGDRAIQLLGMGRGGPFGSERDPLRDLLFDRPGMDFTRRTTDGATILRKHLRGRPYTIDSLTQILDYMERFGPAAPRLGEDPRDNFPV